MGEGLGPAWRAVDARTRRRDVRLERAADRMGRGPRIRILAEQGGRAAARKQYKKAGHGWAPRPGL